MRRFLFLLFVSLCSLAQAYPEMVRNGYVNCTSCHIAPNGGGVLTEYGKSLSEEKLSTWRLEGESKFAYGLLKTPEWLSLGGDVRTIQTYREDTRVKQGRLILMQADIEAGVTYKNFQAVGTFGYQDGILSRRHYLLYHPSEALNVRAGRFGRAYGLNDANHYSATKDSIGLGQGKETYNVEVSWLGDSFDFFATAVLGRPDDKALKLKTELGTSLRSSVALGDSYKVGLSYFYGGNETYSRHLLGPYAILGFTPRFFALFELDFQNRFDKTSQRTLFGFVSYTRLNYEVFQGAHAFLTYEFFRHDLRDNAAWVNAPGVGLQWFPRPHFEFQLAYQKQLYPGATPDRADFGWFTAHLYL